MRSRREMGMALATALLVLMLVSTMIVGLAWLVMTDQKLGGNSLDRQRAFYGAEGGMEALTAGIENAFNANPGVTCNQINGPAGVTSTPPADIPGIQFLNPSGTPGYQALFNCVANLPSSAFATITTGPYAGLYAQTTPYTLQVTARSTYNSEVKLQREIQTVAIPVFQFGMFSQTDLDFFAGPNFNFGGRVHTNGNLWLAEGPGNTLTMSGKVTAAGEIVTANLENGFLTTGGSYGGAIDITNGSAFPNLLAQAAVQSVQGNGNFVGNLGPINEPAFANVASGVYKGDLGVKETGVKPLNLAIATPGFGNNGQPIDLIRRGMLADSATKLAQRYYGMQGMGIRIMLSDYGPGGTCASSDISSTAGLLPNLSPNLVGAVTTPVDLATLAWDTGIGAPVPYNLPQGWLAGNASVTNTIFPLPISGSQGGAAYAANDGYWVKKGYPTITGCLKIDYQAVAGNWVDVTDQILKLGWTGRNINPQPAGTFTAGNGKRSPTVLALPGAQVSSSGPSGNAGVATVGCADPSPQAVIRLARVRDNPSFANVTGGLCGNPVAQPAYGSDYWPNVLYDTREGMLRDTSAGMNAAGALGPNIPVQGAMYYVELDVQNLANCLTNAGICAFAGNVAGTGTTGFAVYFSDRRSEQLDPNAPPSVPAPPGGALTGGYGYDDIVNPLSASSCPNGNYDQGEDPEGDYVSGVDPAPLGFPRVYGNILAKVFNGTLTNLWPVPQPVGTLTTQVTGANNANTLVTQVLTANLLCPGGASGRFVPYAVARAVDLRENPSIFFRRALKIVNGESLGAAANPLGLCGAVPCGLTIVSENPVYIQGDYNNNPNADPTIGNPNADPHVAASVVADAVTLLSDNWNDVNSFAFPYGIGGVGSNVGNGGRNAVTTTYRLAIAAGKNVPFQQPAVGVVGNDFGTDGGAHNFLRYIENWGPATLYYRGSIVSMYYSHQAFSTFKCCNLVYDPPTRGYNFDADFQQPAKLPPLTPMLRDVNTIGFTQMSLPTQ
jgi:hypothetical protein